MLKQDLIVLKNNKTCNVIDVVKIQWDKIKESIKT